MNQAVLNGLASAGGQAVLWLIAIGLAPLIVYGVRIVRAKAQQDETAASAAGRESAWYWLETGAEKAVIASQQYLQDNDAKRQAAIQFLQDLLDTHGYHFPVRVIAGAIEAAVAQLKQDNAPAADRTEVRSTPSPKP